jgi:hypothetical protein
MHKEKILQLREIAKQIEERREFLSLSKNSLCQKFGQLGSTKTYGRILNPNDELDQLDIGVQLENYQAAWEIFQTHTEDTEEEKVYGDFEFMVDGFTAVREAMQEPGITRLVLITAGPGGGKSAFITHLQRHPATKSIIYKVEATEAWRESTNELLGALLLEVGVFERQILEEGEDRKKQDPEKGLPIGPGARLRKLIERLNGRKVILAIDEGHHIGPAGYNILKTLLNQTKAVVVMAAHPDLILRINKSSHAEASQLFVNRLYEHVRIGPPQVAEVMEFMKRRGVKFASSKEANEVAAKIVSDGPRFGLWKYVFRCTRKARLQLTAPATVADFAKIIVKVKSSISLG